MVFALYRANTTLFHSFIPTKKYNFVPLEKNAESIYNLSGIKVLDNVSSDEVNNSILDAGIYVARYADGTSKKIFIQ